MYDEDKHNPGDLIILDSNFPSEKGHSLWIYTNWPKNDKEHLFDFEKRIKNGSIATYIGPMNTNLKGLETEKIVINIVIFNGKIIYVENWKCRKYRNNNKKL